MRRFANNDWVVGASNQRHTKTKSASHGFVPDHRSRNGGIPPELSFQAVRQRFEALPDNPVVGRVVDMYSIHRHTGEPDDIPMIIRSGIGFRVTVAIEQATATGPDKLIIIRPG